MSDRQTYLRHPLEIAPLVFGLIFLGIVAAWGLFELDVVSGADAAWILPIVLIASGALGIVLAATKDRRARRRYESMYVAAPTGTAWPTATDESLGDTATSEHTMSEDAWPIDDAWHTEDTRHTDAGTGETAITGDTGDTASFDTTTQIRDPQEPSGNRVDDPADPVHPDDDTDQPGATR